MSHSTARTRRRLRLTLLATGVFSATLALAIPTLLMPRLAVIPAAMDRTVVLTGSNAEVLSVPELLAGRTTPDTGVNLESKVRVRTAAPTSNDKVTFVASQLLTRGDRSGADGVVTSYVDWVTINRRNATPVVGQAARTQFEQGSAPTPAPRSGFQYTFPIGISKRPYAIYDPTAMLSAQAAYLDDNRTVNGVRLYHFLMKIDDRDVSTIGRPGSTLTITKPGSRTGATTSVRLHYGVTRELWVEPTTGMVVDRRESVNVRFVGRNINAQLIKADLRYDTATVNGNAALAKTSRTQLHIGRMWLPLVAGPLGIALILLAIWRRLWHTPLWRVTRTAQNRVGNSNIDAHVDAPADTDTLTLAGR